MIKTALIPAAGLGNRMNDLTKDRPKCLLEINGQPLLKMQIEALEDAGFEQLVIVTGYKAEMIEAFVANHTGSIKINTVHNPLFDSTNNIYSVWLALSLPQLSEGFTLIESDLVFDSSIISVFKTPDLIALDDYDPTIHSGTVAVLNKDHTVNALIMDGNFPSDKKIYKTVNITSFSAQSKDVFKKILSGYIKSNQLNIYYEAAIKDSIENGETCFKAADFSTVNWGEIDTPKDLKRVKSTFRLSKVLE